MKHIIIFCSLFLSGCYLANGSPNSINYWVKNNKTISKLDSEKCGSVVLASLDEINKKRFIYLKDKYKKEGYAYFIKHPVESDEYSRLLDMLQISANQCYYNLGYRFNAPYYWCVAESNMKTCRENQKYRY